MKRYAVADEVPVETQKWLSSGKEYEMSEEAGDLATIFDDDNIPTIISPKGCAFLFGKPWRIVEREL